MLKVILFSSARQYAQRKKEFACNIKRCFGGDRRGALLSIRYDFPNVKKLRVGLFLHVVDGSFYSPHFFSLYLLFGDAPQYMYKWYFELLRARFIRFPFAVWLVQQNRFFFFLYVCIYTNSISSLTHVIRLASRVALQVCICLALPCFTSAMETNEIDKSRSKIIHSMLFTL